MLNPPTTGNAADTGIPVLLFDGHCNLCSGAVRFIIRHETKPVFIFASLQSSYAENLLGKANINFIPGNSILLVENDEVYEKSEAVLRICTYLRFPWKFLKIYRLIPRFVRDYIYDFIARKRYSWFGRSEICMVPDPKLLSRFRGI